MIRKILSTHKVKPHNDRAFYQNECRKLMKLYQEQAEHLDWDCGYLLVYQKKKILLFEGGTVGHKLFCLFGALRCSEFEAEITGSAITLASYMIGYHYLANGYHAEAIAAGSYSAEMLGQRKDKGASSLKTQRNSYEKAKNHMSF